MAYLTPWPQGYSLDLFVDRPVGGGDYGVAAEFFQFSDGLAAANDIERSEAVMDAELDDHSSEVRAGGGLEQPLSPGHGEDVADDREHGGRVNEEGSDLLVGDVGGNRAGLRAGMTAYSAQFPPWVLMTRTRFPLTNRPINPGPTSSTKPTPSNPGVAGRVGKTPYRPSTTIMSDGFMGLMSILTRTSPGPGWGSGTSRTCRTWEGSPNFSKTAAFISSPIQRAVRPGRESIQHLENGWSSG